MKAVQCDIPHGTDSLEMWRVNLAEDRRNRSKSQGGTLGSERAAGTGPNERLRAPLGYGSLCVVNRMCSAGSSSGYTGENAGAGGLTTRWPGLCTVLAPVGNVGNRSVETARVSVGGRGAESGMYPAQTQRSERRRADALTLEQRYLAVRHLTSEELARVSAEDAQVQSMPDSSPLKWHLGHTTWFFEKFVLGAVPGYECANPAFDYVFNSYYDAIGPRVDRARRGQMTRPTLLEVLEYRRVVDARVMTLLASPFHDELADRVRLGLEHEQQHQELILMDLKHLFGHQPLLPVYRERLGNSTEVSGGELSSGDGIALTYAKYPGGLFRMGTDGPEFRFDNEGPAHVQFVPPFELAQRLVTNGEFLEFVADGGYRRPELWLSDGFQWVKHHRITSPMYWHGEQDCMELLRVFTLHGLQSLNLEAPVCHVSYYEADAYARWAGARLPTEAQWEYAAQELPVRGNFLNLQRLDPLPARGSSQMFGDVWEWTQSAYAPYPGYRADDGALGEYNGKFMCNQMVLRGGSCVTPPGHVRRTYRNFFAPHCRWQFSGIRLARDI